MNSMTPRQSLHRSKIALSGLLFVLLAMLGQTITGSAQTYRGGITGTVSDSSGASVAGATITAVEDATNISYRAVSTSTGDFDFSNLPVGTYTVTFVMNGFSTAKYDKVNVAAGASYVLPAKLAVSSSAQTVEVTAASLALDTASDVQGTVLPEVIVQNLPNSGRDFTQMLAQTTGFAGYSTGGGGGVASVDGTRTNSVNWQIQGTDNNDLWWNIPAINQGGVSALAGVVFPIDAIENFSFVTSGEVQLGRNSGGTANLTVKSGGNKIHGTAYDFNHNEFFERQNPFLSSKGASRLLDYGFSLGGPIMKDKIFLFVAGEHQNFLIGGENKATEPSVAYQANANAILAAYGVPQSTVTNNLLNGNGTLQGLWPTSALTGAATPQNYVGTGNITGHSFNGVVHLDAKVTDKDQLSAVWSVGQGTQVEPTTSELTPYFEVAPIHVQNYSLVYNRSITSSIANQLGIGVSYFNQVFSDASNDFNVLGLGLNTGVDSTIIPGAPNVIIGPSSSGAGLTAGNTGFDHTGPEPPSGRNDITGHLDEDLTWVTGPHQFHFGGEVRQTQVDDFYQTGQRGKLFFDGTQGAWSGNAASPCASLATKTPTAAQLAALDTSSNTLALADFLAGCIDPTSSSIVLGNPKRQVFVNTFAIYGQDNWQVSKKLNLNYGLRYDYEGPVHSHFPNLSTFDPSQASGLAVAGQQVANIYGKFWGAASPRIGFAYQLDGTGLTVLRGGYGIYYDSLYMKAVLQNNGTTNISVFGAGQNPVGSEIVANTTAINAVIQPGVDIFPTLAAATSGTPSPGSLNISAFDKNFKPSNTQEWDLNIQHSLSSSVIAQIGYVGTKGSHLQGIFDVNPSAPNLSGSPITTTRPYYSQFPQFGVIDEARSNLGSIYHSLQTSIRIQNWHGLTSSLGYTWSHALDYESGLLPYLPQDPLNEKGEYGNADFDVRNSFVGNFDYLFPTFRGPKRLTTGWELSSGFQFHGGTPYTVDSSEVVPSGNGDGADRAVQVASNPNSVPHGIGAVSAGVVQWFSPTAFVDPAPGTYSPTRRGQNYNPGYGAFDLTAIKTTSITERVSFKFQANMYNLFNRTNLAPVGFPATGEGGTIGSTIGPYLGNPGVGPGEPLNVEFAGKIIF